jgi:signal transduction histidine kinase
MRTLQGSRWFAWSSRAVLDKSGQVTEIVATGRDITDRRRAEEERLNLELRFQQAQKLESLGILAGGIAHDFNNLLMAILGNADLALQDLPEESPARINLSEIDRASRRAAELCRQMLAYSGRGHFELRKLDLSELVREMAQILAVSISKKAALECSFAESMPAVEADAAQIRQIVLNLITNASGHRRPQRRSQGGHGCYLV